MTWRDIKDAPRDGTQVLVAQFDEDGPGVWPASWSEEDKSWSVVGFERAAYCDEDFSHWMPLPPPPGEGVVEVFEAEVDEYRCSDGREGKTIDLPPTTNLIYGDRVRVTVEKIDE